MRFMVLVMFDEIGRTGKPSDLRSTLSVILRGIPSKEERYLRIFRGPASLRWSRFMTLRSLKTFSRKHLRSSAFLMGLETLDCVREFSSCSVVATRASFQSTKSRMRRPFARRASFSEDSEARIAVMNSSNGSVCGTSGCPYAAVNFAMIDLMMRLICL